METIKKTTIHRLTERFVEIDTEDYIEINGQEIKLELPKHSVSYENSIKGRDMLLYDQPENVISSVFSIWGENPKVTTVL